MKVALFVHCFFPEHYYGTETYTLQVARNLKAMGHAPVVVTAVFPGEPRRETLVTRYEYQGIPVYCIDKNQFPHERIRDTYYQPALDKVLKGLLLEIAPDLIHVTHLINHTAVLVDTANQLGIPAVATLTDFFGFCFNNRLEAADGSLCRGPNQLRTNCIACTIKAIGERRNDRWPYRWLPKHPWALSICANLVRFLRFGRLADAVTDLVERPDILTERYAKYRAVIAPTRFLASAYVENGLRAPLYHMRFGIDVSRAPKVPPEHGAPIRFGFIGQLAPHKGADLLIEAFCRLQGVSAELKIFGAINEESKYISVLKTRAEGFRVKFEGAFAAERISAVLNDLDILVLPSRWHENSPLVLLAALASRTPVIVSDVEGMSEFIEEGKNGFRFQRGSVDDLERVMRDITLDPGKSRAMSEGTEYLRSTREMTEDLIALYRKVLEQSPTMAGSTPLTVVPGEPRN
jgi:glycosyltransferase involved in cell wall biosynthesis